MSGQRTRNVMLTFYVTENEKEVIKQRMALIGLKNMSTYLRKISIDGYLIKPDYSFFNGISQNIEGVSRNINQIAKRANATESLYADDVKEIKDKQGEIWQLLKFILSQLP